MNKKIKYGLGAFGISLTSLLYFGLAYIGYDTQTIDLKALDTFTGQIVESGTTTRKSGKQNVGVFFLKIDGLDETLGIYRMNGNYQELVDMLRPNDLVTVYYRSQSGQDVNIDLVQIEKNGKAVVTADEYKKKESALIYIGLIFGIFTISYSVYYFRKNTR